MFEVAFSVTALVAAPPLVSAITAAIKLDDGGPVLYSQERTAAFGDTFTVYKFQSMVVYTERKGTRLIDKDCDDVSPGSLGSAGSSGRPTKTRFRRFVRSWWFG